MPTTEERYQAATVYTRRAIDLVESQAFHATWIPALVAAEWYAGRTKTEYPRAELARIEAAWLRATTGEERARIARDAELLADRVQENLAGAPQDRARTNLTEGEKPTSTSATSYAGTVAQDAADSFAWLSEKAERAVDSARVLSDWLLAASVVGLGWKVVELLERRAVLDGLARSVRRTNDERDP